jgi:hypothetical protein
MKLPLPRVCAAGALAVLLSVSRAAPPGGPAHFSEAPHSYWEIQAQDPLQQFMTGVQAGKATVDGTSERTLLNSMLKGLGVPESSQMLVFSATSFQSGIVNPRSPRALYFNDLTSVGFIPGGRLEVASFDPQGGMMFYIFDRPRGGVPSYNRSRSCMNCHTDKMSSGRPGHVINSVGVWWDGSTQETYRYDDIGHQVPLEKRFGGWHLTGIFQMPRTHANLVGNLTPTGFKGTKNEPGEHSDLSRYPRGTSDLLVQLVHEHQCGFTNRVIAAIYAHRENPADTAAVKKAAAELAAYALFKDEAAPPRGLAGEPDFVRDFQALAPGSLLRQFDLQTRLFKYRASYMLETPVWQALPQPIRQEAEAMLLAAVAEKPSPAGQHLSADERKVLRPLLTALADKTKTAAIASEKFPAPSGAGKPNETQQTK